MLLQALTLTHHITTMLFGIFLSAFFLGVKQERKNVLLLLSVGLICLLLYIPCILLLGETYTDPISRCWYISLCCWCWFSTISSAGCLRSYLF